MKKIFFLLFSLFTLSNAAGTYDSYAFTDTEEKYALFFVNYYTSADFTAIGLSSSDASAIIGLRPISLLSNVANNSNITGTDMLRIREASHRVSIPDQNDSMTQYNALGVRVFDFNFLMALMGALIGFAFAFFLIYSILKIGKKA
jgi:hypothetical protein